MNERFGALADEFIARIRAAVIWPATEVVLVCHCVDQADEPVPPFRTALEPRTTVDFPGHKEAARQFAGSVHVKNIIDNINSLVRHAPSELIMLRDGPSFPVRIRDFSLEINQPAS
jgi:hypothetical protein